MKHDMEDNVMFLRHNARATLKMTKSPRKSQSDVTVICRYIINTLTMSLQRKDFNRQRDVPQRDVSPFKDALKVLFMKTVV